MMARFPIVSVQELRGPYPYQAPRWPSHRLTLANGNIVDLAWDESENSLSHANWAPRVPMAGDTLIVNEDGARIAVLTENVWRWLEREDCRKL